MGGCLLVAFWQLYLPLLFFFVIALGAILLLVWQYLTIIKDAQLMLVFDGQHWYQCVDDASESADCQRQAVHVHLLFKSNFLVVLGVRGMTDSGWRLRRLQRLYLAADNCPAALLRAVCRVVH